MQGVITIRICHRIKETAFHCNVFAFPGRILSKFILLGKESLKLQMANILNLKFDNPLSPQKFQPVCKNSTHLPSCRLLQEVTGQGPTGSDIRQDALGLSSNPVPPQTSLHLDETWSCQHLFLLLFPQTPQAQISSPRKPGRPILGDIDVSYEHTDPETRNCWLRAEKNGHPCTQFQATERGGSINRRGTFVFFFVTVTLCLYLSPTHRQTK